MIKTPLVIQGYCRPKETEEILVRAETAGISKVYLYIDHPKDNNPEVFFLNSQVKELKNKRQWNFDIEIFVFEVNYGVWAGYNEIMDRIFRIEDQCIFLEDDKIPSISFFGFCDELLEKYKYDERIFYISGLNFKQNYPINYPYDYFFSVGNTPWGHALWRRSFEKFRQALDFMDEDYYKRLVTKLYMLQFGEENIIKEIESYRSYGKYRGHVPSNEFFMLTGPTRMLTSSLIIVPKLNLISDVGATKFSVHGDSLEALPKSQRGWFNRETFEINQPLKHPKYVIPDVDYYYFFGKKKKLTAGIKFFLNRIERLYLIFKFRGLNGIVSRLIKRIKQFQNRDY